jgi:hypothetical protein
MFRSTIRLALIAALAVPDGAAAQRGSIAANPQVALQQELGVMTARLGAGRVSQQDIIADSQRLALGYRSLVPLVRGFGPSDHAINRRVARLSLAWLASVGVLSAADPLVARAVLTTYDAIGGFYRDYGLFYQPGAFVAYAGATRLAQRLILEGRSPNLFERDLDRYALAYGTLATLNGMIVGPWTLPRDLPEAIGPADSRVVELKPVALPTVDVGTLDGEQRTAWNDVRDRFQVVASKVHIARTLLDDLAGRLRAQRMELHPQDAATALKMQSFLEDAAELIQESHFDTATEALKRADYERIRLRSVTGQ